MLHELALAADAAGPLPERFRTFAAALCGAAGADLLTLFVAEGDGGSARVAGSWPVEHPPALVGRVLPAESVGLELGAALANGEAFRAGAGEHPAAAVLEGLGYRAGWVCTLVDRGEPVGLVVAAFRAGEPDARAQALLRAGADLLAAAAAREREIRRAMTAAARARAAAELAAGLSRGDTFETLFAALAGLLPEALPVDYLGLVLRGPGGFALVGETPAGVHRGLPPTDEGNAFIEQLAAQGDVLQFRPEAGASPDDGLALAGYGRAAIGVVPTVVALREKAARVVAAELRRLDRKIPQLDGRVREEIHAAVRRVVDKLLHAPTVRVQELAGSAGPDSYSEALRTLFDLDLATTEAISRPDAVYDEAAEERP
ncbi:MAG: hypothetical protein K6T28_03720 [Acidothermus sp.]|nr:hypothetical protein [Acidothermus sp.]